MRILVLLLLALGFGLSASCGDGTRTEGDVSQEDGPVVDVVEEEPTDDDPTADPIDEPTDEPVDDPEEEVDPGTLLGEARITFYWVAYEGDYLCSDPDTQLGTCSGDPIAMVCPDFASAARLEGTARLVDGRMINIGGCSCAGGFDCFVALDTTEFPWGMGNRSNPLVPFVSVAVDTDVIANGTVLYSPDIDGVALPEAMGGGTHDGCLRADDVGGGITGMHIDFFAALRTYYTELDPLIPENVTLYTDSPRCDI
jgi:3D (Asp-Asp-Asp) domain-containing protein